MVSPELHLSTAYIRPVTGPTPFSGEFALMLNVPVGGQPGRNIPLTPPVIGQCVPCLRTAVRLPRMWNRRPAGGECRVFDPACV